MRANESNAVEFRVRGKPHGDFYGLEAFEINAAFAQRYFYVALVVMTPRSLVSEAAHT